jgi:uncharacterized protein YjbJ (UPF0337 family)/gas vesicle protein
MSDYRESESSEEIKADIAQTRAQMEDKINQIQYKLDPERLKEQAQDTVRSVVADSRTAMADYMRQHREEISSAMLDAVKHNPIPAAMIGVGLGWLVMEAVSPKRDRRDYSYDYERNRSLPVPRDRAVRYESGYSYDTRYDTRYTGSGNWNEEQWNQYGRTPTYGEWQGSSSPDRQRYAGGGEGPYTGVERPYATGPYSSDFTRQESRDGGWAQQAKEQVGEKAEQVGEKAKEIAGSVKDAAQSAGEKAVDAVRDAAGQVGDRIRSGAEQVADRVRGEGEQMGHRMEQMGYQARSRAGDFRQQMSDRGHEFGDQMGYQARQVGRRMEHQVEDNPLMIGAVAFAVGAAVAMLMPQSRMENRYVGETRDRVMDSAKELGQDVAERAQRVVEEVRPELEQTARKVVDDVKQVGKEAAHELQDTAQKAQDKAKQEGEGLKASVESKTGQAIDSATGKIAGAADKMADKAADKATATMNSQATAQKLPENWTTLKGRWNQVKGEAKRQWGKLTDDDLTRIEGDYDKLVGLIQQKYGYSRSQAEQEVGAFSRNRS